MPELGSEAKWDEGQRRRGSAFIISMCKGPGGRVSHEAQGRTPAGADVSRGANEQFSKRPVVELWALGNAC